MKSAFAAALIVLAVAGCRVKETNEADGDTKYDVEPANVQISTDSATIPVPDIDVTADTTARDTTP